MKAEPPGWGALERKYAPMYITKWCKKLITTPLVVMEKSVEKHLEEICRGLDGRTEVWVQRQHKINFMAWIKQQGIPPYGESDESRLASGPSSQITSLQGYDINGYRFHMKEKDKKSAAHNSGVQYEGIDEDTWETKIYYGQIGEVWGL